ncbi:MAG: hypothetical protein JOZ78_04500 [Chroococcidiopsidaceae cyanobacterium CP_BM_ER_R8_30]|nr:hypothetical protein [Chroococcidiopsidaceae cyanobacterium CP_BM_ER_R8_30]
MAQLPEEITTTILELQRQFLGIIDQATAVAFIIVERYGETEATLSDLEQLDNVRERASTYYSRFYTLLLRIAESQPIATAAMLDLLHRSLEEAQAAAEALIVTCQEIKVDWNLS